MSGLKLESGIHHICGAPDISPRNAWTCFTDSEGVAWKTVLESNVSNDKRLLVLISYFSFPVEVGALVTVVGSSPLSQTWSKTFPLKPRFSGIWGHPRGRGVLNISLLSPSFSMIG